MPATNENCPIDSLLTLLPRADVWAETQSHWNWCMNTLWCKIVTIIAIVLAGLVVLSIVIWILRALCCGVTTLCCCCCAGAAAAEADDIEKQMQSGYQAPPNMYYQPNH